jgi:hypothetical protein
VWRGLLRCLGAKEAWASSGYSILTLCVSDGVGLDWPLLGETFWSLLGGEGGWLWGLTCGPESPRAPRGYGKLCLLVSCPRRDPVREAVGRACLGSDAREPPGIDSLGLVFLCLGLGWHR